MIHSFIQFISRWMLLILIVVGLVFFFYFHGYDYLNFATIKKYHETWLKWVNDHYLLTVAGYVAVYIAIVALSVPGATFITLAGGLLFGPIATIYVVISATIGASILFLAVKTALGEWLAKRANVWVKKLERGFQRNAFNYLLTLRLIPLFPFWVINIVAALLNVRLQTFVLATLIGIIPGSFIFVMIGNGLNSLFAANQTPNLNIIFTPPILLPLIGLGILALLPVIYKRWKGVE